MRELVGEVVEVVFFPDEGETRKESEIEMKDLDFCRDNTYDIHSKWIFGRRTLRLGTAEQTSWFQKIFRSFNHKTYAPIME
jgi:hypothetical protein